MHKRIAKRLLASLALAASAALTACATTPAPPNLQVQGRWRLDSAASDDASARIASAIRTAQAKLRAHHRFGGGPGGDEEAGPGGGGPRRGDGTSSDDSDGTDDLGANGQIGPNFQEVREQLQQTLGSPRTLTFRVQPGDVQIQRDDLPGRDYQPGESITRFDEYGTAQLKSTWKDKAFVLSERYTSGARLEERYELDAHGALLYTRSLRDPTVGRIQVKSLYQRASP